MEKYNIRPVISDHAIKMSHFSYWKLSIKFYFDSFDCIASYELPMSFAYPHPHWICQFSRYKYSRTWFESRSWIQCKKYAMRVKYDIWLVIWDHAVKMGHFSHWDLWNFTFTHFDCIASYELPMSFAYPHPHWVCQFSDIIFSRLIWILVLDSVQETRH